MRKLKTRNAAWQPESEKLKKARQLLEEIAGETTPFLTRFGKEVSPLIQETTWKKVRNSYSNFHFQGLQPLRKMLNPVKSSLFTKKKIRKLLASFRGSYLGFMVKAAIDSYFQNTVRNWLAKVNSISALLNSYYQNKPTTKAAVNDYCDAMTVNMKELLEVIPHIQ